MVGASAKKGRNLLAGSAFLSKWCKGYAPLLLHKLLGGAQLVAHVAQQLLALLQQIEVK